MVVSDIQLYELLKGKLGAREAEAFVEILDRRVEKKFDEKREIIATKEDIHNLCSELLRTFYLVSLGQLLVIIGSVIAIISFLR